MRDEGLVSEAARVGEETAAKWAAEVDSDGRFPAETVAELRRSGLLGALVPPAWGGPGASMPEVSAMVTAIASHCGSSGLILAMHQIQVASLVRHASPAALNELLPRVATGEILFANANSEVGLGGQRRASICALEATENGFHMEKDASTVSYGEFGDAVLATARRDPQAPAHDQVLVVCIGSGFRLEPRGEWDSLGMRGTCSRPGSLVADIPAELVIENYADVFTRTSLPVSAVLLSAVWLGLAEAAGSRAHSFVRAQAKRNRRESGDVTTPSGALRLAELVVPLYQMREVVSSGALDYERHKDTEEVGRLSFASRMENLKISSSLVVLDITQRAMSICGLAGYMNGGPFSIGRIMRDAASAPLMVSNDRSFLASAQTLLVRRSL
jgi:acyl-CoA dehydrogenase